VKTRFDATFDAKPSQHDLSVPVSSWCAISDDVASLVDPYRLRLEPVEVVGSMDLVAHIAFEVSLTLLSWTVLRKVLGCPHDELEFVCRVSDGSRVHNTVIEPVHGREKDKRLVVEMREDYLLDAQR
jgi:hypothetical protein